MIFFEVPMCFALMLSLDIKILIKLRNDLIVDFALLLMCLKTENLAYNCYKTAVAVQHLSRRSAKAFAT